LVSIPAVVKKLIDEQNLIVVGSVGKKKICNVSPRIFIQVTKDSIYWLDFFKHKSYRNFKENPFVAVSVFDKENLIGYQLKGDVSFVSNKKEKSEIKDGIIRKTSELYKSAYVKNLKKRDNPEVIKFNPKIIYSLNPEEFSDLSVASEADITQLFSRKK